MSSLAPAYLRRAHRRAVTAALLLLVVEASAAAEWRPLPRAQYRGVVPGHGEVLLDLSSIVGEPPVTAQSMRQGYALELHPRDGSIWRNAFEEYRGFELIARWEGELSADGALYEADWVPQDGSASYPIRLERVARTMALGIDSLAVTLVYPRLEEDANAAAPALNAGLEAAMLDLAAARRQALAGRTPDAESGQAWTYQIRGISSQLISLHLRGETSGAGGFRTLEERGLTLAVGRAAHGGSPAARIVNWNDLQRDGADLPARIDRLLLEEFRREGVGLVTSGAIETFLPRIETWTVSPRGMTLTFEPVKREALGGIRSELDTFWPEQIWSLTLPYAALAEALDPGGVLAPWIVP
ncbi:MAG: hypothetical protein IPK72_05675 [Candidatus Eisenbacteria bacterium]|nr:hypothetical protein [Candidatus Eisenbacteria bacterium]